MSLASLAAYASSDDDSEPDEAPAVTTAARPSASTAQTNGLETSSASPVQPVGSSIDLIEDDDDDHLPSGSVTSSLPSSQRQGLSAPVGSVFEADDVVDDVPLADKLRAETPKKGAKVRISIPSLSEFRDDGPPAAKKPKPAAKGSGLFSLLPPPKAMSLKQTGRPLLPQSVSRPRQPASATRPRPTPPGKKPPDLRQQTEPPGDVDDGDQEKVGGFFSMPEASPTPVQMPSVQTGSLTFSERIQAEQAAERQQLAEQAAAAAAPSVAMETEEYEAASAQTARQLDVQALQQLGGRRGGRRQQDIHIVDVNQDDITSSREEWMMKAMTEEQVVRRPQKSADDPTNQQRRKHQITYLAHQAKEREVELKNEWAQNRATKNAYRSKYGF